MSKLTNANVLRLALVGLACSTLLTVTGQPASAGEPEGVLRTFIVFLNGDVTVDFLHEDSVMFRAKKNAASAPFEFVDDNDPELSDFNFDATPWVTGSAMYITKGEGVG